MIVTIKEIGKLKYDRIKSISIFLKELYSFGYNFGIIETKLIIDTILSNEFDKQVNYKMLPCLRSIFNNVVIEDQKETRDFGTDFPINAIMPFC